MKTYARILDGRVVELAATTADISEMYHPSVHWIDITSTPAVAVGWQFDGVRCAPPLPAPVAPASPSIEALQAQLALLSAQIAALRRPI